MAVKFDACESWGCRSFQGVLVVPEITAASTTSIAQTEIQLELPPEHPWKPAESDRPERTSNVPSNIF